MFLRYGELVPRVGKDVYVDPSARVVGSVTLADGVVVLPCAVVRGDGEPIYVGEGSVVEDSCVLHADEGGLAIGRNVVMGHGAVVHGARVESNTLIGMGATVLKDAVVGEGCLVAAGALVPEGMQVPPGSLVMGVPARVVRPVSDEQRAYIAMAAAYYREWGEQCRRGELAPVEPLPLGSSDLAAAGAFAPTGGPELG